MIVNLIKRFNVIEWLMILTVIIFTLVFSITDKENSIIYLLINSIAAISGIFCVVLCAKGKKSQYIWGLFNIIGYVIIAYINKYYGEVILNALYYLPSQFIGYYLWNKNINKKSNTVISKKMSLKQTILFLITCTIGIFILKMSLDYLGGNNTLLDSASTFISLFANVLMLARYREQWLLWIIIDIITVIMWLSVSDYIMVTMWIVYLFNAFYGYYNWSKLYEKSNI